MPIYKKSGQFVEVIEASAPEGATVKFAMDNPQSRVIEMVPRTADTEPTVSIKPTDWTKRACVHGGFKVNSNDRTVECGKCNQQLDAMHVLILIANSESRRRWMKESAENHERKENEKTIKAAVINLGKRGVDPEKFSELYQKYAVGPEQLSSAPAPAQRGK